LKTEKQYLALSSQLKGEAAQGIENECGPTAWPLAFRSRRCRRSRRFPDIFTVISLLTEIFPCYEFRKSADGVAAESTGGLSLLAIAVIGKPGGSGKGDISPVIVPDHGNLGPKFLPVNHGIFARPLPLIPPKLNDGHAMKL
jgi:hypothetical protein